MDVATLREHCPEKFRCASVAINTPSPSRSVTGSAGGATVSLTQQIASLVKAVDTLTIAQTQSIHEQKAMLVRVLALEQQQQPAAFAPPDRVTDRGTGAFTLPAGGAQTSAEDRAMVEELRRLRPTGPVAAAHSAPSLTSPAAPGADATGADDFAEASKTMLQRATVALEVIAGSGEMARVSMPKSKRSQLFKLEGARGRVAQDELNADFERDPGAVVAEFQAAVKRLKMPESPDAVLPSPMIVEAWREHVPAKEHHLVIRVSEAILNAYCAFRAGPFSRRGRRGLRYCWRP